MFDRCRSWRSLMTRRAEGVLSPTQRALLDNHIAKCTECRSAQLADDALLSVCSAYDYGLAVSGGRSFDDRVVTELRRLPVGGPPSGLRNRVRAFSASFSFEFCMQLAGGGLAAASVTAIVLISALNPAPAAMYLSSYEVRTMTAMERNEPPVPLESLFRSATPRAAMMWATPGRGRRVPAQLMMSARKGGVDGVMKEVMKEEMK